MPFLITYWKQIAIAFVIMLVYGSGYYKGYSNQKVKFDAFKLEVKVNAELQKKQNELLVQRQEAVATKVAKEYKDAISKLHTYYTKHPVVKWLPNSKAAGSRVSEVSSSTTGVDAEAEGNISSTVRDCALDVVQLLYLQKWIESNITIGN